MAKQDNTPSINIQVGAETGKLRIIEPDGSVTRLYATAEEVRAVGRDKIAERTARATTVRSQCSCRRNTKT